MAPWDQLSSKDRNMVFPKIEMLFQSMRKFRIRIPFEILLFLDQKISKIEPEMAELALFCLFFFLSGIVFFSAHSRNIDFV